MEEEDNKKVESTKFTCDAEGPELVVELVGLLLAEEGGQLLRPLGRGYTTVPPLPPDHFAETTFLWP